MSYNDLRGPVNLSVNDLALLLRALGGEIARRGDGGTDVEDLGSLRRRLCIKFESLA